MPKSSEKPHNDNSLPENANEHQGSESLQDSIAVIEERLISDPAALNRILDNPNIVSVIQHKIFEFQGPIPPPSQLREYENILPGAAERLLSLAEKEQRHRHDMDNKIVDGGMSKDRRGQWMGLGLALLILCGAFYFASSGEIGFASLLVTLDLVGLVAVFVLGRYLKQPPDDSDD
ncbi:DUF2335 domain-containing protein [Xenorhabdus bharatensis]|uniref:DUF2335 domain-containing protein n=1 Tax=Xenorhabdus bharatensis TaxID=3136256 RepID=UPI0030F3A7DA